MGVKDIGIRARSGPRFQVIFIIFFLCKAGTLCVCAGKYLGAKRNILINFIEKPITIATMIWSSDHKSSPTTSDYSHHRRLQEIIWSERLRQNNLNPSSDLCCSHWWSWWWRRWRWWWRERFDQMMMMMMRDSVKTSKINHRISAALASRKNTFANVCRETRSTFT